MFSKKSAAASEPPGGPSVGSSSLLGRGVNMAEPLAEGVADALQDTCLALIFSHMDMFNIVRACSVCKRWLRVARSPKASQTSLDLCRYMTIRDATTALRVINNYAAYAKTLNVGFIRFSAECSFDHFVGELPSHFESIDFSCVTSKQHITDDSIATLCELHPNLVSLNVFGCWKLSDKFLIHLIKLCPHLQRLNCASCNLVTDDGVGQLAALKMLADLNLWRCENVTDAAISVLGKSSKHMKRLVISDTKCSQQGVDSFGANARVRIYI